MRFTLFLCRYSNLFYLHLLLLVNKIHEVLYYHFLVAARWHKKTMYEQKTFAFLGVSWSISLLTAVTFYHNVTQVTDLRISEDKT